MVKSFMEPGATGSGDFLGCKIADGFKEIMSGETGEPVSDLWKRAQTIWVNPKIFQLMNAETPQRACSQHDEGPTTRH
jgi:hypothetical protein